MLKRIFLAAFVALAPSLAFALPPYLGDFQDGSTTHEPSFYFNANAQDPPIAAQISTGSFVLIDAAGTESSGAITWTASVNSRNTGRITIDMGHASIVDGEYSVLVDAGTADSIDVSDMVLFSFSVGRYASAPSNFESLSVDGSGRVDVAKISGTTQTARDIGASVLLSSGTGTGQLSFSSGLLAWNPAWDAEAQSEATDALNAYDPPTSAEMDARTLPTASYATASALATVAGYIDTEIGSIIASLTTIDDFIDTEVAAIKTVTDQLVAAQSEPTGVPAANETPLQKIARLYMVMRNGIEITANSKSIKDDAGNVEWVKPLADDETTFSEGEAQAP